MTDAQEDIARRVLEGVDRTTSQLPADKLLEMESIKGYIGAHDFSEQPVARAIRIGISLGYAYRRALEDRVAGK